MFRFFVFPMNNWIKDRKVVLVKADTLKREEKHRMHATEWELASKHMVEKPQVLFSVPSLNLEGGRD